MPLAAGTVTGAIATFCVHAWASPVSSAKAGTVSVPPAGSSVRVRVALLSERDLTWATKATTSVELVGVPGVRLRHIRVGNHYFQRRVVAWPVKMIRPVASNSGVNLLLKPTIERLTRPAGTSSFRSAKLSS